MGLRFTVILISQYVIQLTLYFVGTIVFHASAVGLLSSPYGGTPGLAGMLSSMNLDIQVGLTVEGFVILLAIILAPFRSRPDTARL